MKKVYTAIFYALTLVGITIFIVLKRHELVTIISTPTHYIFALFVFNLLPVFLLAFLFKMNIRIFNLNLKFKEWFGLTVSNTMYGYLLPFRGGLALRAYYLKQKYKFSYASYSSFLSGYFIINFIIAALVAAIIAILFGLNFPFFLWYIIGGVFIANVVLILLYLFIKIDTDASGNNRFLRFLINTYKSFVFYKQNPKLTLKVGFIQALFIIVMGVRLYFSFTILNIHTNLPMLIFIQSMVTFSRISSITPGNIGIKEGLIGMSASLLGISTDEALLGAVLDRMVSIVLIFLLGLIYSRLLLKEIDEH